QCPVNLLTIWHELEPSLGDNLMPSFQNPTLNNDITPPPPPQGKKAMIEMAMCILSITPNSASTEQIFSQFGVKHTKHRNRMHPDKIHREVLLKMDATEKHGLPPRHKCKFGDEDKNGSAPAASTSTQSLHFLSIAQDLISELEESTATLTPSQPTISRTTGIYTPDSNPLSLKNLFYYPDTSDITSTSATALTDYWRAGEVGLMGEMEFHDMVNELERNGDVAIDGDCEGTDEEDD
ncbi:hypothetical protein H0H87_008702, partial [Tephrocybe sp. NHM501043]